MHEAAFEAIGPATDPACLWHDLQLILVVGDNLSKLILDVCGVNWLPPH